MAKINLLPWRTERRKLREREFYMMLGAAIVAGILAMLAWVYWMDARLENQDSRNALLTQEIKTLDIQLTEIKNLEETRARLLQRKQIIEQLQANRSQMVHLFDELVRTIPDGVRLSSMKQTGDTLTLAGVAQSNASVADYMKRLDASPWLKRSDLQQTESKGTDRRERFEFGLTVKLTSPEEKEKERLAAEGKTAPAAPATPAATTPAAPTPATPTPPPTATSNAGSKP
jgi:type IV pilus assembly protein PilN